MYHIVYFSWCIMSTNIDKRDSTAITTNYKTANYMESVQFNLKIFHESIHLIYSSRFFFSIQFLIFSVKICRTLKQRYLNLFSV